MEEVLSYENDEGKTVFTSKYYRNKGTCCRSNCLHCPFGTTLKNLGLELKPVLKDDIGDVSKVLSSINMGQTASSLLAGAFGDSKKTEINKFNFDSFRKIFLKDTLAGVARISFAQVSEIFLKEHFRDQGIDKDIVGSYLEK